MDDTTNTFKDVQTAITLWNKIKIFSSEGGFQLTKGKTNSSTINEISYQNETSYSPKSERTEQNVRKVLGLKWNIQNDNLLFDFENFVSQANSVRFTKRNWSYVFWSAVDFESNHFTTEAVF